MAQVVSPESAVRERASHKPRAARILGTIVFISVLTLIALTAIPYGTAHAWFKALFVAVVFALAILWIIELSLSQLWITDGWPVILPVLTLALFSLLQTLPVGTRSGSATISLPTWNTISFDPYQTRFFVLQLVALTLSGLFLFRYASTERRLRILINVVIGVAVATAIFGILRQTMQHGPSFGLPFTSVDVGYGQFINRNHFAFLMEMGFGLSLGMILGAKKDQTLIYLAAILPIWTALVLCGSRGGLVAMLAQVIAAALLYGMVWRSGNSSERRSRLVRIAGSLPVRFVLLVVLVCGVLFGTLWLGGDRLATRIEQSRTELESDNTTSRQGVMRNDVWRMTWRMFSAHPILGVGMNGYWIAVPIYHDASGTMTPQEAHNDYLELLASGGVVGLAIGVWFAVAVFRRTRENLASPDRFRRAACFGATVGIAGVAVHSLVDFGLHMIVNALIFTTLIVIATSKPQWEPKLAIDHE